jgi:hypothetical protein
MFVAGVVPALGVPVAVQAAQNNGLRSTLKYQDAPKGEQRCSACMHFVPGKSASDRGGCKYMPGDTEISPNGWCLSWVAAKR